MSLTETARQSVAQKNEQRVSSELSNRMDAIVEQQLERVEAVTRELAPVVQAMSIACQESKATLTGLKATAAAISQEVSQTLARLRDGAGEVEVRSRGLTLKVWAAMIAAAVLVAVVSVSSYSLWRDRSSGDREEAARWRDLTSRYQRLPQPKQRQVDQLIYATPSR